MCGRFVIKADKNEMIETFDIHHSQISVFTPHFNLPPGTHIPYIYEPGNARVLGSAHWGLIPSWAKDKASYWKAVRLLLEKLFHPFVIFIVACQLFCRPNIINYG